MAKLTCKNKNEEGIACNCTYFEKVQINEFHDLPTNLTTGLREVEVDSFMYLYRCIRCNNTILPPVEYYTTAEDDRKLYVKLQAHLDGEEIEVERSEYRERIQPGQVGFVKNSVKDNPVNHGKFLKA